MGLYRVLGLWIRLLIMRLNRALGLGVWGLGFNLPSFAKNLASRSKHHGENTLQTVPALLLLSSLLCSLHGYENGPDYTQPALLNPKP